MSDAGGDLGDSVGETVVALTDDPIAAVLLEQIASPDDQYPNFDQQISPMGEVVDLSTPQAWIDLHFRIIKSRPRESNMNAWRRCLAIMRHLDAHTVIFEHHYVCLEYRSEFITFYAHVDKSVPTVACRLHFFKDQIDPERLGRLTDDDRDSYLGYVVTRPADLPIVGRAHMRVPDFVDISTAVTDRVHLFGQELEVLGVPFMEQESRMAECGNVALWVIHHTAYLRGIFERKFIADFIDMPENRWPMRVSSPRGINPMEAAKILDDAGFHSEWMNADEHWLPPPIEWSDVLQCSFRSDDENDEAERARVTDFARSNTFVDEVIQDVFGNIILGESERDALEHYNQAIVQQLKGHLQSGFPVYVGTNDHALVACGIDDMGRIVVHDDQFGPYLTADRLISLSRSELNAQTPRGSEVSMVLGTEKADFDQWWAHSRQTHPWVQRSNQIDRASLDFIFAHPPRVFQRVGEVRESGLRRLQSTLEGIFDADRDARRFFGDLVDEDSTFPSVAAEWQESTVLVKGVTYKDCARKRSTDDNDPLCEAMSWVQLSEWVTVVELIKVGPLDDSGKPVRVGVGEIVYDSSSDHLHPRMLVLRVGNQAVFRQPKERLVEARTAVGTHIRPLVDVLAKRGINLKP